MTKLKKFLILFAVFWFLSNTPFMFEGLNQISPWLFGMPFTVWSFYLLIIAGCLLLTWGSKSAWDSFDDCDADVNSGGVKK
jgi:hypothetical protein